MIIEISGGEVIEKSDKSTDNPNDKERPEITDDTGVQIVPMVPDGHFIERDREKREQIIRQIRESNQV